MLWMIHVSDCCWRRCSEFTALKVLCDLGADLNTVDIYGNTPLTVACKLVLNNFIGCADTYRTMVTVLDCCSKQELIRTFLTIQAKRVPCILLQRTGEKSLFKSYLGTTGLDSRVPLFSMF